MLVFYQVVVRVGVGLNRNTTSSVLNTSSSSSPIMGITQPMVATVEPQQTSDAAKTMEQRRMEAREILIKERQRKMSSPNRLTPRNIFNLIIFVLIYLSYNLSSLRNEKHFGHASSQRVQATLFELSGTHPRTQSEYFNFNPLR